MISSTRQEQCSTDVMRHELYVLYHQKFRQRRKAYRFHPVDRPVVLEPCITTGNALWHPALREIFLSWISAGCALYYHNETFAIRLVTLDNQNVAANDVYCICLDCSENLPIARKGWILAANLDFYASWEMKEYTSKRTFLRREDRKSHHLAAKKPPSSILPHSALDHDVVSDFAPNHVSVCFSFPRPGILSHQFS